MIETKIDTKQEIWKAGKQVFGSVQRECSWLINVNNVTNKDG